MGTNERINVSNPFECCSRSKLTSGLNAVLKEILLPESSPSENTRGAGVEGHLDLFVVIWIVDAC